MRVILFSFFLVVGKCDFLLRVWLVLKLLVFSFFLSFSFPNVELSQDILRLSSQDASLQVATECYFYVKTVLHL